MLGHFVAGITARTAAELLGVNRNTATRFFKRLREVIAKNVENESMLSGEVEVDESYFGGRMPAPKNLLSIALSISLSSTLSSAEASERAIITHAVEQKQFVAAINNCDAAKIRLLLADDRVDVNAVDDNGEPPLWLAAERGTLEIVKLLLGHKKIEVNQTDTEWERTPLHVASHGRVKVATLLLKDKRLDVNRADSGGRTSLHMALLGAQEESEEIVKLLLADERIDVNQAMEENVTSLYLAVEMHRGGIVKLLLADKRVDVNQADAEGKTPLHVAAQQGHEEMLKLLLSDKRIDVNCVDREGNTPLHLVAEEEVKKVRECEDWEEDWLPLGLKGLGSKRAEKYNAQRKIHKMCWFSIQHDALNVVNNQGRSCMQQYDENTQHIMEEMWADRQQEISSAIFNSLHPPDDLTTLMVSFVTGSEPVVIIRD